MPSRSPTAIPAARDGHQLFMARSHSGPGACALPLPPIEESAPILRYRRDDWLYLTMGLSQPLDRKQVKAEREAGKTYSSYGIELGFIVPDRCDWPADALTDS